ncbi:MAG: hypothetical protein JWQ21_3460 [Herminiimonas sp.]|nr:hypothetical protein [Herminiimonas sp.]
MKVHSRKRPSELSNTTMVDPQNKATSSHRKRNAKCAAVQQTCGRRLPAAKQQENGNRLKFVLLKRSLCAHFGCFPCLLFRFKCSCRNIRFCDFRLACQADEHLRLIGIVRLLQSDNAGNMSSTLQYAPCHFFSSALKNRGIIAVSWVYDPAQALPPETALRAQVQDRLLQKARDQESELVLYA